MQKPSLIKKIEKPTDIIKQPWILIERTLLSLIYRILCKLITARPPPSNINKILLIRRNRLGDAVSILPTIEGLKTSNQDITIHVLSNDYNSIVFTQCPFIDKTYIINENGSFGRLSLLTNPIFKELRSEGYDIVIGMGGYSSALSMLAWKSSYSYKAGPVSANGSIYDLIFDLKIKKLTCNEKSHVYDMACIVRQTGLYLPFTLPFAKMVRTNKARKGRLAICPDAKREHGRYSIGNYERVIKSLLKNCIVNKIVLLLNDENSNYRILEKFGAEKMPANSVKQLISELSLCEYCIIHDGGGAHIASALGLRTIVITGAEREATYWRPYGHDVTVFVDKDDVNRIQPESIVNEIKSFN